MDAISAAASDPQYASPPPIVMIGQSPAAVERARRTAALSGMRLADVASFAGAPERIRQQARASAPWVEIESDCGRDLDAVLAAASSEAEDGRCPAVVAAPFELLDAVAAQLSDSVQLVIDGSDSDRAAALAIALAGSTVPARLSDVASDRNTARLRQLSDEVSRIAATLARISSDPVAGGPELQKPAEGEIPDVPVDIVRSVIRARRLRSRYFSEELFADPAWDMLIELKAGADVRLLLPSRARLCLNIPPTTSEGFEKVDTQR